MMFLRIAPIVLCTILSLLPYSLGSDFGAGHGVPLLCTPGNALIGACTSGENKDCQNGDQSHRIKCSGGDPVVDSDQLGSWKGKRISNPGSQSAYAFCPDQHAIQARCAGGRDEDCSLGGGVKYDHGIRCAPIVATKVITEIKAWKCGDHGKSVECPAGYVATASCASGKNNDCDWEGCRGQETYTGLICKRVDNKPPPPPEEPEFSTKEDNGFWKQTGTSGPAVSFSWMYGTSTTDGKDMTTTQGEEITAEVSAGMSYTPPPTGGVGSSITVTLSKAVSTTIAKSVSSSFTKNVSTETTIECGSPGQSSTGSWFPFQWYVERESDGDKIGYTAATDHYVCTGSLNIPPRCPLGHCVDQECQTCSAPFGDFSVLSPTGPENIDSCDCNGFFFILCWVFKCFLRLI